VPFAVAITPPVLTTGCVIPPSLEPDDGDAGPSFTPVILEAGPAPDFSFPGPVQLHRPDARQLSLALSDADVGDILYLRFYVDYGRVAPTPVLVECQAAPTGVRDRVVDCPVGPLCTPIATTDSGDHVLEAMVADRPFISDGAPEAAGQPAYRALADAGRAGWSLRSWVMRCDTP
jgi:hypothetical protein